MTNTNSAAEAMRDVLLEVDACFDAAIIEGLIEALKETPDERLHDLITRRLMPAREIAINGVRGIPSAPAQEAPKVADKAAFEHGVMYAASVLVSMHDAPVHAATVLKEAGLRRVNLADLDDFEHEHLITLESEGIKFYVAPSPEPAAPRVTPEMWAEQAAVETTIANISARRKQRAERLGLCAAPRAEQPQEPAAIHPDDAAVNEFAEALKAKLAKARSKGRGGWQTCPPEELSRMLRDHVEKGDPRDVANFCMFLWWLNAPISAEQPTNADALDLARSCGATVSFGEEVTFHSIEQLSNMIRMARAAAQQRSGQ